MHVYNFFDIVSSIIVIAIAATILSNEKTATDIEQAGAVFTEALVTVEKG